MFVYASRFQYLFRRLTLEKMRLLCALFILEKCGKDVIIERRAKFVSKGILGDNSGIGIHASRSRKHTFGNDVIMRPVRYTCQISALIIPAERYMNRDCRKTGLLLLAMMDKWACYYSSYFSLWEP